MPRVAVDVDAGEIHTGDEHVTIVGERLRREEATIRQAPDTMRVTNWRGPEGTSPRQHVAVFGIATPLRAVRMREQSARIPYRSSPRARCNPATGRTRKPSDKPHVVVGGASGAAVRRARTHDRRALLSPGFRSFEVELVVDLHAVRRMRDAGDRHDEGAGRHGGSQPALPAEGPQARREASGDRVRARRSVAPDAARVSLHAVLSLVVRYNQWLQSQGYIVMSVNYRAGIGYGNSFRRAPNTQGRGNSEYQDVLAGAKYLQTRADVDPARVGIWGLSYGGLLTAEALARNSDVFVAGVDLAGVHIYGSAADTTTLAFRSSAVGAINGWKSPVFLQQGDDDRNVDFAQMVGLVSLLRAKGVYYELTVTPDDVHESLIHSRWIDIFSRSTDFLHRFVWEKQTPPAMTNAEGTDVVRRSMPLTRSVQESAGFAPASSLPVNTDCAGRFGDMPILPSA